MLFSIGIILLSGFTIGLLLEKIKVPKIVGMILIGMILGPYCFNFIDDTILHISTELRLIALVIILTRAGLSVNIKTLKKIGRPAILMCIIPATCEIIGTALFAPILLNISLFEALLLGSVLGAVSPAIIIPKMIKLQDEQYGKNKNIPELLISSSSVDDIYVIVLFYSFLTLVETNNFSFKMISFIPVSIVLGILVGVLSGFILNYLFKILRLNLVYKVLLILSVSFLLIALENVLKDIIQIASLLGVMSLGMVLLYKQPADAKKIEKCYQNIWVFFEILLFVLLGVSVNLEYISKASINIIGLLFIILSFRIVGVILCLIKTKFNNKEKLFCVIAYIPKATVQASIGGIALSAGLLCGELVLTVAVISIIIFAPLGAILIDLFYKKLLKKS